MSVCEDRVIENTFQSDDTRIAECVTVTPFSSECCESRQVYSSVHFIIITSHDQFTRGNIIEPECTVTKSNGSQFRQVYSSFSLQAIHSQIQHENNNGMPLYQTEVISNWACLFIILSSSHPLSNTVRRQSRNTRQPNRSVFKLGKSIHHLILSQSLFNSNEAQ